MKSEVMDTTTRKYIVIDGERFYYNEIHLEHGRKQIDREIARENIEIFYNVIEKTDITYGLFFGTLLGAVREKNFIAHDEDTDIYVFDEEKLKVKSLIPKLREVGLEMIRYEDYMISLMRKDEYIDLYFFKKIKHIGGKELRKNYYSWEFDAELMENQECYDFLGMSFPVPANPEHMLEIIYGKTWRTPIKNYNAPKNTIIGKISYLAPIFKKLPFYDAIERFLIKIGK
ncbi:LicD family protein [Saccharicrinis sp. FJH62]|uniref:LicD family protein n=1 Tax=Saccharicrinis sp. FJH62 TaxID=3344657 RepID=UPI0035D4A5B7